MEKTKPSVTNIESEEALHYYVRNEGTPPLEHFPLPSKELVQIQQYFANEFIRILKSSIDETASFRSTLQLYSGKDPNQSITSVEAIPPHVSYQIGNGFIHFQDLPQAGTLSIFNIQGKLIREEPIPSGNSRCLLPELPGVYLLQIQAGDWTESIKYRK